MVDDDDDSIENDGDADAQDFDDTDTGSSAEPVADPSGDPYERVSGFIDDSSAESCRCDIVVDERVAAGMVRITRAVANAIAVKGRGRSYANVFDVPAPSTPSKEQQLLAAIFGEKPKVDLDIVVEEGALVRRRTKLVELRDGVVTFVAADEGRVQRIERVARPTKKIAERVIVHLEWQPPVEIGDVLLDANERALGTIAAIDDDDALRVSVRSASATTNVDVRLALPQTRERIVARHIGPYSLVTGRPIGDVIRMHPGHVEALLAHDCEQLVDEIAWRSEASSTRPALFEAIVKGEDPLAALSDRLREMPETTLAVKQLRGLAAVLGIGIDVDARGLAIFFANLGASLDGRGDDDDNDDNDVPPPTTRAPAGAATETRNIFSFFEKPKRLSRLDRAYVGAWSHGEVKRADTLNYRTLKPEPGGLFCQRIFGPVKDYTCACGKYERMKHRGVICEKCGVEVMNSAVRAERLGHIALPMPVLPWPLRNIVAKALDADADVLVEELCSDGGASLIARLRALPSSALPFPAERALWRVVPVAPPDHRPLIPLADGRFATSDLNDLYRRVINRRNRMQRLMELGAPVAIIHNEHRQLQEAVDTLLANGEQRRFVVGPNKRRLVDVCDALLAALRPAPRAVDFAARAIVIVDDDDARATTSNIAVPFSIALEILRPWLYARLERDGVASTIKGAKELLSNDRDIARKYTELEAVGRALLVCAHDDASAHGAAVAGATIDVVVDEPAFRIGRALANALGVHTGDEIAVHVPLSQRSQSEVGRLIADAHAHAHVSEAAGWVERAASIAPRKKGVASRSADLVDEALRNACDDTSIAARLLLLRARST